ncbi:class I SAM-dependent methyltransferase [Micromonospora sp. DT48]|uniref:class I SAM-dependent methyltransferase n=1 Tax=Micromonospora sp. DT48 TaxID=3393429 RepID=UPI003CF09D45
MSTPLRKAVPDEQTRSNLQEEDSPVSRAATFPDSPTAGRKREPKGNDLDSRYDEVGYGDMIRALNTVHYAGETTFYGKASLRPCEETLFSRYGHGSRILDVGCGAGRVTRAVTTLGGNITGVDVNGATLNAARASTPLATYVHASMADLPFPDGNFDQVWCLRFSFNALPTVAERQAALREFWRVCAPGGTVIVEAFNWYFPGRFGLLRLANRLDAAARHLKWLGQGRHGSLPLPPRDIIYLANKATGAAPGYAHLTTVEELRHLTRDAGLAKHMRVTDEAGLMDGSLSPVRNRHRGYSSWLLLSKPTGCAP